MEEVMLEGIKKRAIVEYDKNNKTKVISVFSEKTRNILYKDHNFVTKPRC